MFIPARISFYYSSFLPFRLAFPLPSWTLVMVAHPPCQSLQGFRLASRLIILWVALWAAQWVALWVIQLVAKEAAL